MGPSPSMLCFTTGGTRTISLRGSSKRALELCEQRLNQTRGAMLSPRQKGFYNGGPMACLTIAVARPRLLSGRRGRGGCRPLSVLKLLLGVWQFHRLLGELQL